MNFPSPGTKCADCGICAAAIYADGTPICWHCDAGEPCPGPQVAAPIQPKMETQPMPLKGQKLPRISEETKAAIIAADPNISNIALAKQYGVSDATVWLIRKKAGIKSTATARRGRGRQADANATPAAAQHPQQKPAEKQLQKITPRKEPGEITVTICSAITEERAKAIFATLAPHLKAVALQAGLLRALEEA